MPLGKQISGALALDSSLGRTIALFMTLLLLAGIITSAWTLDRSWQRTVEDTERNAVNLSISQARQAEDTFLQIELALTDIRRTLAMENISTIDAGKYHVLLEELTRKLPQLHGMFIYDAQGNWKATSYDHAPATANNGDREYFIYHRENPRGGIHIGQVIRSRTTNDLIIPVSIRINDPAGGFAGVILATVTIDYFRHFYNYFELEGRDLLAMMNIDGTAIYVRPFPDSVINRNLSSSPLFTRELTQKDRGSATWTSAVDNIERIFGFARLERYPLVVAAGYDKPALWSRWLRDSLPEIILSVVFSLGVLLIGSVVFRQVRLNVKNQVELATLRDELTSINHTLQTMALADGLTGLANRRQFELTLAAQLKHAERRGTPLSLVMIDVDYFKNYNDTYGHVAGDECLRRVGDALSTVPAGPNALIARYGGEEFAMILPDTEREAALKLAQHAVENVRALRIPHSATQVAAQIVTISAGSYTLRQAGSDLDALTIKENADKALYEAKTAGKDRALSA